MRRGWLGLILGTRLWYAFWDADGDDGAAFERRVDAVCREIGHRGKADAAPPQQGWAKVSAVVTPAPAPAPAPEPAPVPAHSLAPRPAARVAGWPSSGPDAPALERQLATARAPEAPPAPLVQPPQQEQQPRPGVSYLNIWLTRIVIDTLCP